MAAARINEQSPDELLARLVEAALMGIPIPLKGIAPGNVRLTRREREVLSLLAEGMPNRQIADQLFISLRTTATHVNAIYRKLGVSTRSAAAAWAVRNGFG